MSSALETFITEYGDMMGFMDKLFDTVKECILRGQKAKEWRNRCQLLHATKDLGIGHELIDVELEIAMMQAQEEEQSHHDLGIEVSKMSAFVYETYGPVTEADLRWLAESEKNIRRHPQRWATGMPPTRTRSAEGSSKPVCSTELWRTTKSIR